MTSSVPHLFDIAVVGAGAAGLFAAIWAGRHVHTSRGSAHTSLDLRPEAGSSALTDPLRIVIVDGAKKLGAKILVAGGGRCNVTHHAVDESAYAGASRKSIRKVLLRFPVERTIEFFASQGVDLKREDTGKLFPVADQARVVLDAILAAARDAGVEIRNPWRVGSIAIEPCTSQESMNNQAHGRLPLFRIARDHASEVPASYSESQLRSGTDHDPTSDNVIFARRVILATGGKSLPKTGSDGLGHTLARALGHTITDHVFPALVPLVTQRDWFISALSGITLPARIEVISSNGKRIAAFTNSTLLTHFGLSGPGVLDISRYLTQARIDDPGVILRLCFLPEQTPEGFDRVLLDSPRASVARLLIDQGIPDRLARALCQDAGIDPGAPLHTLDRAHRSALVSRVMTLVVPVVGDRGYTFAEVTAGGVPLSEIRLETMESRVCPGLHICGELCDVDGRIGGFNFQWAWASGFVAGSSAAANAIANEVGTNPVVAKSS